MVGYARCTARCETVEPFRPRAAENEAHRISGPLAGTRSRPVREFERRWNSEPEASAFRLIARHLIFRRARDTSLLPARAGAVVHGWSDSQAFQSRSAASQALRESARSGESSYRLASKRRQQCRAGKPLTAAASRLSAVTVFRSVGQHPRLFAAVTSRLRS